ncbi:MAG: primosomal protein N' [Tannerellaceae bacterium]|nr:primosomal protein N' [Tannerellaceae bacterium]
MMYAEVILPLSLENSYTYRVPADMEKLVTTGCRVIVHFGKKRYYTALVMEVHNRPPRDGVDLKEIYALLDATPVIRRPQLRFWEWISSYYLCKLGDVYKAALPTGLKLESETTVRYNQDFEATEPLKKNEQAVLDAFTFSNKLTVSELEKITGLRNVVPVIAMLMARGAVEISEELKKGFAPKMQAFIRLPEKYQQEENLQAVFDELKRAKKQEQLLIAFLDISQALNASRSRDVSRKELLEYSGCSAAILDSLLKRGILESYGKEISRLQIPVARKKEILSLSAPQQKAFHEIYDSFQQKDVCLLHGVTSSGKTEIYIHLIDSVLKGGRQVLYLLPEIAITTQITERLAKIFGDRLLVYHSRFSDNERVEIWNMLLNSAEPRIVLGVRSSLFLPFRDLGLVIIDEEHENTYKQQDPAPRYHARNAAMVLAGMHGGKTLLGSATPSLESYFNALSGKYGFVQLTSRYGECLTPEIIPVNIKELKRKKIMKDELFSPLLIQKTEEALAKGEQVILFQNRRGFAPMIECKSCGCVPHCVHCDVSLTYHKYHNQLVCHYCGYKYPIPQRCPECSSTDLKMLGFGTEKVEDKVAELFPGTTVERLDIDSARSRSAYERILNNFESGKTHILIGTQMLSKGLDFGNVGIVGILNADNLMNFPDFRAHERAYQLMVQVSGRAGRREKRGTVVLQTSQPEHPLIGMVQSFAYENMVKLQLSERSMFRYPPYYRLIYIIVRSRNAVVLEELAYTYAEKLRGKLGERVLGPVTPPVNRIQSLYIKKIVLKIEVSAAISPVRKVLEAVLLEMQQIPTFRQLIIHYDVDPA